MTDNIIDMNGGTLRTVNADYVQMLEDELERAKSGEATGGVLVTLHRDNAASFTCAGRVGGFGMVGAIEQAKQVLLEVNAG